MKHNQFSPEVAKEIQLVTAYSATGDVTKAPACADNYKAQALRELANRLILEQIIFDLKRRLGAAQDLLDVEAEELVRGTGYNINQINNLLKEFKG